MHCKVEKMGVDPRALVLITISSDELCFVDRAPGFQIFFRRQFGCRRQKYFVDKIFFSSTHVIHELLELYKTETILLSTTKLFVFQLKISSPSSSQHRPKFMRPNFHLLLKMMILLDGRLRWRYFSSTMKNFVSSNGRCPILAKHRINPLKKLKKKKIKINSNYHQTVPSKFDCRHKINQ